MFSCKGQWFLIGAALLIVILVSLYSTSKTLRPEKMAFKEEIVYKHEILLSKILEEEFKSNETMLKKIMGFGIDVVEREAEMKGYNASVFVFCIFNTTLLVLNSFDNTQFVICSSNCISENISKYEFKNYTINLNNNFVSCELTINNGELCANHTYKTDFCAGVFVITDGKNRYVGRTLNLNAC